MYTILLVVIYLSFISLGLPDSLLGSAWPTMYNEFDVPISYAGIISMIIALGTIISSLQSDRVTKKLGIGKVTVISVALTTIALFGFSTSNSFYMLVLWAIPYGLGAGSIDAALNNYVAVNYKSRHMSWLHCMWGVGTIIGPYFMGYSLTKGFGWTFGYRCIAIIQTIITVILLISSKLWKKNTENKNNEKTKSSTLNLREIFKIAGIKEIMIAFFCYCAIEQTTMLWASSYMVLNNNISLETAATFSSLFFIGITVGRAINGFLTFKFTDTQMIRIGEVIIGVGTIAILISSSNIITIIGLILIGLGCAPIYPSFIHITPNCFGADKSQAIIGVQMACAYTGTCIMPPIFGLIANHISIFLFPIYLLIILILMIVMHEKLVSKTKTEKAK